MPQWSLRTLLIATAAVPLAIFAISKSTPICVSAVLTIAAVAWIAVAIMAGIDTGSRQAWARGFILAATAYGLLVAWQGTELDLRSSHLQTSRLLFYTHHFRERIIVSGDDFEEDLGLRVPSSMYDAPWTPSVNSATASVPNLAPPPDYEYLYYLSRLPDVRNFALIGHVYWGVLIGLAGGCFACWIDRKREHDVVIQANTITPL